MTKIVDRQNDATITPETPYEGSAQPRRTVGKSAWAVITALIFIVIIGILVFREDGPHTNPAPNGASGSTASNSGPSPTQNSR